MKFLITSDLHGREDWYFWLLGQSSLYDALIVAGDLLDMSNEPTEQIAKLWNWTLMVKQKTTLLVCDGNHDFNSRAFEWVDVPIFTGNPAWHHFAAAAQSAEHWMDVLTEDEVMIGSGVTAALPKLGGAIVTSLYDDNRSNHVNSGLWEEGAMLRRKSQGAAWFVLHHRPPKGLLGDAESASPDLEELIDEYQPRAVFCGHDHQSPFRKATCAEVFGLSAVFNPGWKQKTAIPCHILLDTRTMKYEWGPIGVVPL